MELQFGPVNGHDMTRPAPTRTQLVAEKAEEITSKAANRREKKPLTEGELATQIAAKDARLDGQVGRLNSKLESWEQLDPARVKEAAKKRNYDNVFYATLGKIERRAEAGTYTPNPYYYLTTGRLTKAGELRMPEHQNFYPTPTYPKSEKQAEAPTVTMSSLEQTINRLSRAMAPKRKSRTCAARPKSSATTNRKEAAQGPTLFATQCAGVFSVVAN
jgi:hypothetical protein